MLFCHPESDATTARHKGLAKTFGIQGAPGIAFLTADGTLVLRIPPSRHSVEQFAYFATRARHLLEWGAAAAGGDARAAAALLILQMEEGLIDLAAAEERRAELDNETDAERARLDEMLFDRRLEAKLGPAHDDHAARVRLGGEFLALLRSGTPPSQEISIGFWYMVLDHCEERRDADGYALGLEGLRQNGRRDYRLRTGGDGEWKRVLIARCEAKLALLRAGG